MAARAKEWAVKTAPGFGACLALGLGGVAFILCQMALTVAAAYLIGRRFGFGRRFCLLMGAGNAVCGSSAIATVSPVVGAEYVPGATIFKIVRIVFIVLVALAFSRLNHEEEGSLFAGKGGAAGVKAGVPWFIIGFFVLAGLNTLGLVPAQVSAAAKFVSGQFEVIALAAIGMRVKFRDLVREGPRALSYGLLVGGCQVLFALGLIRLLLG